MPLPAITRQREIIDRRALGAALAALAVDTTTPDRKPIVALLREALNHGRAEIERRFEEGGSAAHCVAEQCFLIDQLIRTLFDFVAERIYPLANPTEGERLAIVAVGGYGRGEMAPYSDVDLLFLFPYKQAPSRSSNTCSTCCGICGSRSATPPARSPSACVMPRPT
jgi:[protein-PII] uridylyltransferase